MYSFCSSYFKKEDTSEIRLNFRRRQIERGKTTLEYQNYITLIPKDKRNYDDMDNIEPRTPSIYSTKSKRGWEGVLKRWRYYLHQYDQPGQFIRKISYESKDKEDLIIDELDI